MLKILPIIFTFIILTALVFTGDFVEAIEVDAGSLYAGISYNTFDIDGRNWQTEEYLLADSAGSGLGYFAGARYWLTRYAQYASVLERTGIGAEVDLLETVELKDGDREASVSTIGFLATAAFNLLEAAEDSPVGIALTGAGGIYQTNFEVRDEIGTAVNDMYRGPGIKAGIQATFSPLDDIRVGGRVQYRYAPTHSEGDIDLSGFEINAMLKLSF